LQLGVVMWLQLGVVMWMMWLQLGVVMWLQLGVVMWLQLGVVMLERGSHKEALQNFELALQFDPKHRVSFELFSYFVRICTFRC